MAKKKGKLASVAAAAGRGKKNKQHERAAAQQVGQQPQESLRRGGVSADTPKHPRARSSGLRAPAVQQQALACCWCAKSSS